MLQWTSRRCSRWSTTLGSLSLPPTRNYAIPISRMRKPTAPVRSRPDLARKKTVPTAPITGSEIDDKTVSPLWPLEIINKAVADCTLSVPSTVIVEILDELWQLAILGKLNKTRTEAVLDRHKLDVQDLVTIAVILMKGASDKRMAILTLDLFSISADIGNETAALILIDIATEHQAIMSMGLDRYKKALLHVRKLAKDNQLQALVLLGKVHEGAGQFSDAMDLYRKAMILDKGGVYEDERVALADAYRNCSRLALASGKEDSSAAAFAGFEIAALEYEDPYSFYHMALIRGDSHQDYVTLLSQAAISGVLEATYELGLWYSKQTDRDDQGHHKRQDNYKKALYWWELAKDLPNLHVRVNLHRARIERSQSLRQSQCPTAVPINLEQWMEQINIHRNNRSLLLQKWSDPTFDLTTQSLENQMESRKK